MPQRFRDPASFDPFAITPDPSVYVPRAATENARKELLRSARNPAKTSALIGPPGLGKTLLLQLLAKDAPDELQIVYLPYAALPPEELCGWALEQLDLPGKEDPIAALQSHSWDLRERGSALLLLIDDVGSMPVATARWAGTVVEDSGGCLRLAVAASDNASGHRIIAAIGSNFDIVHLDDPMTEAETRKYIDGRLALARVPNSIRARFDDQTVRTLHRISAGIPRRLHAAAMAILQEAPAERSEGGAETAAAAAGAPATTVDAPAESAAAEQTLGVPSEERRSSNRRAEPEGVEVRVVRDGRPVQKGRRAEDRIEAALEPSEPAAEESEEIAPTQADAAESEASEWAPPTPPPPLRAAAASRRSVFGVALLVGFAAVAIPLIRSLLSEPRQIAGADPRIGLPESAREQPREPSMQAEFEQPAPAEIRAPIAGADSGAMAAQREVGEIRAPDAANLPPRAESPAEEPDLSGNRGPFAVQINAKPWANVEVDGIDLGATPLANIPLYGGAHSFRVELPDGRVIDRIVEIDAERRFFSFE